MVTNQMTHEAAMAVSIIDQIEGKDVQSVQLQKIRLLFLKIIELLLSGLETLGY